MALIGYFIIVKRTQNYWTAQTAGIIAGMETVYGIFFAFLLLGEIPTARELVGGAVILGVALLTSLDKKG